MIDMLVYDGRKFIPVSSILNRPEILDLTEVLGLEYLGRSFYGRSYVPAAWTPEILRSCLLPSAPMPKPRTLCERLADRNHHRKNFSNVYTSDYNYSQLSFDWD